MALKTLKSGTVEIRIETRLRETNFEKARELEQLLRRAIGNTVRDWRAGKGCSCIRMADGIDEFISHQARRRGYRSQTLTGYRRCLNRFAEYFGGVQLDTISRSQLDKWVGARLAGKDLACGEKGKPVARSTVQQELKILRTYSRWGVANRKVPMGAAIVNYSLPEKRKCRP